MKQLALAMLLLSSAGCDEPSRVAEPPPPAAATLTEWQAPNSYRFDVSSTCGERSFIGDFRITVEEDQVNDVEALDQSARASIVYMDEFPTLQDLLDEAKEARSSGADVVEVETTNDGRPTHIEIDHNEDAIDDESCYEITRYKEN